MRGLRRQPFIERRHVVVDQHEQERITARIDEARVTKLLSEEDPISNLR